MNIVTNNQYRELLTRYDVPDQIIADHFDYLDQDEVSGFFKYKNLYYHLGEFIRIDPNSDLGSQGWHGSAQVSNSSSLLVSLSNDCDQVKIGHCY